MRARVFDYLVTEVAERLEPERQALALYSCLGMGSYHDKVRRPLAAL